MLEATPGRVVAGGISWEAVGVGQYQEQLRQFTGEPGRGCTVSDLERKEKPFSNLEKRDAIQSRISQKTLSKQVKN